MDEKLIREILELADGVEVTEDHRNQALVKLHEQNEALSAGHQALVGVVGDIDPAQVPVQLKAGKINGFVVIKASEHETLIKAQEDLAAIQDADDDKPVITLGKVVLTETKFNELEDKANKGVKASEDMLEMKVDKFLDDNVAKFTEAQRPNLRKNLLNDFDTWSEDIAGRPDMDSGLFKFGGSNDPSPEAESISTFVSQREIELKQEGNPDHEAYSLACKEAEKKFGNVAFEEWEDSLATAK